jgi:APA family basic amino acid/polyamine antiporter
VNAALLAVVPVSRLAGSTLAAAEAADVVFGGRGRQIITVLSLVSLPPLLNAVLMIATRILFAMGRDRLIAGRLSIVTPGGAPVAALVLTTAVAAALVATGTFQKLVAVASFFLAANYGVCCLALIRLRQREPATPRPFRAWGYPWTAWVVCAGAVVFLIGVLLGDTMNSLVAIGLLAAGLAGRAVFSPSARA